MTLLDDDLVFGKLPKESCALQTLSGIGRNSLTLYLLHWFVLAAALDVCSRLSGRLEINQFEA